MQIVDRFGLHITTLCLLLNEKFIQNANLFKMFKSSQQLWENFMYYLQDIFE